MKKLTVILASLALVVMISGAALAGPGGHGRTWGPGMMYGAQPWTQEQIEKANQARAKFLADTLELRRQAAAKAVELRTLYAQPKPDQAKIKSLAAELVDLRSAIAKKRIEAFSGLPLGLGFGRGMGFGMGRGFGPRAGYGCGFGYGMMTGYGYGHGFGPGACWR